MKERCGGSASINYSKESHIGEPEWLVGEGLDISGEEFQSDEMSQNLSQHNLADAALSRAQIPEVPSGLCNVRSVSKLSFFEHPIIVPLLSG